MYSSLLANFFNKIQQSAFETSTMLTSTSLTYSYSLWLTNDAIFLSFHWPFQQGQKVCIWNHNNFHIIIQIIHMLSITPQWHHARYFLQASSTRSNSLHVRPQKCPPQKPKPTHAAFNANIVDMSWIPLQQSRTVCLKDFNFAILNKQNIHMLLIMPQQYHIWYFFASTFNMVEKHAYKMMLTSTSKS